jgi:hypothetical protein
VPATIEPTTSHSTSSGGISGTEKPNNEKTLAEKGIQGALPPKFDFQPNVPASKPDVPASKPDNTTAPASIQPSERSLERSLMDSVNLLFDTFETKKYGKKLCNHMRLKDSGLTGNFQSFFVKELILICFLLDAQRRKCPIDAIQVLKDNASPLWLLPTFIITLNQHPGLLVEFLGASSHVKLFCLNRSVDPPELMTKRLTEVASSSPPPKKQLSLSDMKERITWIDKLISNEERRVAEVESDRKLDQAAKSAERKSALAKKKVKNEAAQELRRNSSGKTPPKSLKRKKIDSDSNEVQDDGLSDGSHDNKRRRTRKTAKTPKGLYSSPKSNQSNNSSQFIDFHGTQMSGMTFMLTPDLAKSGATLTLTLSNPSNLH